MKERHLLALSGGKDSAALAVYMREKYPHLPMEYVFIDSGCELPETYAYLDRIRAVLGVEITTVGGASRQDRRDFPYWLKFKGYYLPSPRDRWCTEKLKLIPYQRWVLNHCSRQQVHSYVGLRADEKRPRFGLVSCRDDQVQHRPFVEDGVCYADVERLLVRAGLGFPAYYEWRTRSGCFFCFYQTRLEWAGLRKHHPDLFAEAVAMEHMSARAGKPYTWNEEGPLTEIVSTDFGASSVSVETSSRGSLLPTSVSASVLAGEHLIANRQVGDWRIVREDADDFSSLEE